MKYFLILLFLPLIAYSNTDDGIDSIIKQYGQLTCMNGYFKSIIDVQKRKATQNEYNRAFVYCTELVNHNIKKGQ